MFGPVMAGERVRLEPPRLEYAATYIRWFADREVTRYLLVRHPTSLRKQEEWIEQMAASADDVLWAMVRAADGELIGNVGFHRIIWRHHHGELVYVIGERDQWGKGCATEAIKLATAYAFLELGFEKAGYRQCGLMRRHVFVDGQWHDVWLAEVLREDWERESSCSAP